MESDAAGDSHAHDLLPQALREKLPPLYAGQDVPADKKIAHLKIFDPCSRWTWFATEFDGVDVMFGFVRSGLGRDCDEWGYFSLEELRSVRNKLGLRLERDLHWTPGPVPDEQDLEVDL